MQTKRRASGIHVTIVLRVFCILGHRLQVLKNNVRNRVTCFALHHTVIRSTETTKTVFMFNKMRQYHSSCLLRGV